MVKEAKHQLKAKVAELYISAAKHKLKTKDVKNLFE